MALRPATALSQDIPRYTVLRMSTSSQSLRVKDFGEDGDVSQTHEVVQESDPELSEDDQAEWKTWYGNLKHWDFDLKSLRRSDISGGARRDSLIEPGKYIEPTTSDYGDRSTAGGSAAATSSPTHLFPLPIPQSPLKILSQLRIDVGIPALATTNHVPRSTVDARQPGTLTIEVEALQKIITSSLGGESTIPLALQSSLLARLECVLKVIEKRRFWDRSQRMFDLEQRAASLVPPFVDLLDPLRTCIVCGADHRTSTYHSKTTATCSHTNSTCNSCLEQWMAQQLNDQGWDKIKCAECPELLTHSEVRSCATHEVFER
jgi:hypothetical protein